MTSSSSDMVNLLTNAGANTNLSDSDGLTPLIIGKQTKWMRIFLKILV